MKTQLTDAVKQAAWGDEVNDILRTCVHCGFCTAVCPTYQLLGNELDGPRGRIYLIKSVLEGNEVTAETQKHLDRCLTCRSCETTCPSGVKYGQLIDRGRELVEHKVSRQPLDKMMRWGMQTVFPEPKRFASLLGMARLARPILPSILKKQIPVLPPRIVHQPQAHTRKMLILEGCVQPTLSPNTNDATIKVLDKLGISVIRPNNTGCCGALDHHLSDHEKAQQRMRKLIDAWWAHIEAGAEAIIVTASGCGSVVKEYDYLLKDDPEYADKAAKVATLAKDISEIIVNEDISPLQPTTTHEKIAVHVPCTLQHGQKLNGVLEPLLIKFGFQPTPVPDSHLCCGSAGVYSVLQPDISAKLRDNKLASLNSGDPQFIVTANIGCQMHLQNKAETPVKHWIELIAERLP